MEKKYTIINDHCHMVEVSKDEYQKWKDYIQLMYGNGYEAVLHDSYLLLNPLSTRKFGPEPIQAPPELYNSLLNLFKNASR